MRLTAILLTAFCLQVSASGISQLVTYSGKNVPLETVLQEVKKQTGYFVLFDSEVKDAHAVISVSAKGLAVPAFLDKVFNDQPLSYSLTGTTITVRKKAIPKEKQSFLEKLFIPSVTITGHIINTEGQPLTANIVVKRLKKGITANAKGDFSISDVEPSDELIISFIGYKTQTIDIGYRKQIFIIMEVAVDDLDKVVIQAYGTTSDRLRTGNIGTVTAEEIKKQPIMNVMSAAQGRIAGLAITQTSGYASAPIKIEIRGRSNISPDVISDPLYVIDGVPLTILDINEVAGGTSRGISRGVTQSNINGGASGQSPFYNLNAADIESITVLKDADATAIYGSRGADGVILITTKKGRAGKLKVDANVYYGMSKVTRKWKMLNNEQYVMMRKEALKNDGLEMDNSNAYDLLLWDTTRNVDWQEYLWGGTGTTNDAQVNISGGDSRTTFRIAGGYHGENSITTFSGKDEKVSFNLNLNNKSANERFKSSFNAFYVYTNLSLTEMSGQAAFAPIVPTVFDSLGNLNYSGWDPGTFYFNFQNLLQSYSSKTSILNSRLELKYEIAKGLQILSSFGYSTLDNSQLQLLPIVSQDPSTNPTGTSSFGMSTIKNKIVEPQLSYDTRFGRSKLNAVIGGSLQSTFSSANTVNAYGYVNDNLLQSASNASISQVRDNYGQYKYAAVFGRINYNWNNTYIINLSARRDGSSRFGSGKQYGNFGAIGAAWIFTELKALKNRNSILSFGKLRMSYGITGNDKIGEYNFLTRWTSNNILPYQGQPAYIPTQHANPLLQWQDNKKLESAIQLGFFKDKLSVELAWYQNRCGNQLQTIPLSYISGFEGVIANFPGLVQNRGLEITLSSKIIDRRNISWSANFNFSMNKNKLLAYPNIEQTSYANTYIVGEPLTIARILHFTGVDPATGYYTFEDKNKDGEIDGGSDGDDIYVRDLNPKYFGGFSSDFSYKGFSVSFFFYFKKQIGFNALLNSGLPGLIMNNQPIEALTRWQKPGDITDFPKFTSQSTDPSFGNFANSDGQYTDASFIRLQNLSIGYDLPKNLFRTLRFETSRVYMNAQNVFVITKYKGLDPEFQFFGGMPPAKTFTLGLQLTF